MRNGSAVTNAFSRAGLRIAAIALIAGLCACATNRVEEPRPSGTGTVEVVIEDVKKQKGQMLVNLFLSPSGFPNDPEKAHRSEVRPVSEGRLTFVFEDVPAGPIAISAIHDKDEDFELDTNFFGIPTESWGVSKDAQGFMGPPSFGAARLELEPGQRLVVPVPLG